MENKPWAIGVDIGGTKIEVSHIDLKGQVIDKELLETDYEKGFDYVINEITTSVIKLKSKINHPPIGIGIGMAGQVEAKTGVIHFAPNLKWKNVPLREALHQTTKIPIVVTNDVRAALWGEWFHGAGRGYQNLICVFIGTGIGGGILVNGTILEGAKNSAAEIGHMSIDLNGPKCICGNIGCFEAHSGGWAIGKRAENALEGDKNSKTILRKIKGNLTGKDVIDAAHSGDKFAQAIVQEAIRGLGVGITNLVNIFNPECIILGGGVIYGLPEAQAEIEKYVKKHALPIASDLKIVPATLRASAGTIGAATFAMYNLKPELFSRR